MDHQFLLHPRSEQKLRAHGLAARADAYTREESGFKYAFPPYDVQEAMLLDLQDRGYFHRPIHELAAYGVALVAFDDESAWAIERRDKIVKEELSWEDFPVFGGFWASLMLDAGEFWHPERFGFDNIYDFHGSLSAYMVREHVHPGLKRGYCWTSTVNGVETLSEVNGSEHGDLRIYRTDVTPYRTLHPSKQEVGYRPVTLSDRQQVCSYHSVEPALLATILKYVDQVGVQPSCLADKGKAIVQEFLTGPSYLGNFADAGYGSFDEPVSLFIGFEYNIPEIDRHDCTQAHNAYALLTASRGRIGQYIDPEKNLCFSIRAEDEKDVEQKRITLRMPPNEMDHLIRGLFTQAKLGLGRTSVRQLVNVLEYRFSEQFAIDRARWRTN